MLKGENYLMQNNQQDAQSKVTSNVSQDASPDIPKGQKKILEKFSVMQSIMPMQNPIVEKLTPEHISTILTNSDKESERYFKQNQFNRTATFIFGIITLGILAFIMFVFKENIKDIHDILLSIVSAVIGAVGGYGYGLKKGGE